MSLGNICETMSMVVNIVAAVLIPFRAIINIDILKYGLK